MTHTGRCWLYCLRDDVPVTWIGPVHTGGATAPMYACEPCIRTLTSLAWDALTAKDRATAGTVS